MAKNGTPRKRPYDVKRKLVRAIERAKAKGVKVITGGFGRIVRDDQSVYRLTKYGCAISCYLDGRKSEHGDLGKDACAGLGLTDTELNAFISGFDNYHGAKDSTWWKVGEELRP